MTYTIELSPEEGEEVEAQAKTQGVRPEVFLHRLLLSRLKAHRPVRTPGERLQSFDAWIARERKPAPPIQADLLRRVHMYEDEE